MSELSSKMMKAPKAGEGKPKAGLVAVVKRIERAGAGFQQKFWIKPEEAHALSQQHGTDQAIKQLGGDVALHHRIVGDWAANSSTTHGAVLLQARISKMLGVNKTKTVDGITARAKAAGIGDAHVAMLGKLFHETHQHETTVADKTILAMAAIAQGAHKGGGDTIKVWRGINGSKIQDAIDTYKKTGKDKLVRIKLSSAASFSESEAQAKKFGKYRFQIDAPKSAIVMSHKATPGLLSGEQEIVLASHGSVKIPVSKLLSQNVGLGITGNGGSSHTAGEAAYANIVPKLNKHLLAAGGTKNPLLDPSGKVNVGHPALAAAKSDPSIKSSEVAQALTYANGPNGVPEHHKAMLDQLQLHNASQGTSGEAKTPTEAFMKYSKLGQEAKDLHGGTSLDGTLSDKAYKHISDNLSPKEFDLLKHSNEIASGAHDTHMDALEDHQDAKSLGLKPKADSSKSYKEPDPPNMIEPETEEPEDAHAKFTSLMDEAQVIHGPKPTIPTPAAKAWLGYQHVAKEMTPNELAMAQDYDEHGHGKNEIHFPFVKDHHDAGTMWKPPKK